MDTYTAYIRVEINDRQLKELIKKARQPMGGLEDIHPQVVVYEGKKEIDWIPVFPQILKIIDSKDRKGQLVLEGEVYPGGKSCKIALELSAQQKKTPFR